MKSDAAAWSYFVVAISERFVLNQRGQLAYYKSEKTKERPQGLIDLCVASQVNQEEEGGGWEQEEEEEEEEEEEMNPIILQTTAYRLDETGNWNNESACVCVKRGLCRWHCLPFVWHYPDHHLLYVFLFLSFWV